MVYDTIITIIRPSITHNRRLRVSCILFTTATVYQQIEIYRLRYYLSIPVAYNIIYHLANVKCKLSLFEHSVFIVNV